MARVKFDLEKWIKWYNYTHNLNYHADGVALKITFELVSQYLNQCGVPRCKPNPYKALDQTHPLFTKSVDKVVE